MKRRTLTGRYALFLNGWISFMLLAVASSLLLAAAQDKDKLEQVRQEEEEDYFAKWLKQDVRYLIRDEEKDVFLSLTTSEEKERFIEQFWFRRDPDTSTAINEFKEEHYRRIAYANEHFDEGTDGWLTDRGRIYIIHGPPDEIESHVAGEIAYERRPEEGGGTTTTFPFIRWWYRHIEGVGDGVELEFVDKRFTGAYRLTTDSFEKDALFHTPFGATWAEEAGVASRLDRYRYNPHRGPDLRNYREQDNPFEKYRRFVKVQAPQPIKYRDLEKVVDVNITYQVLPVKVRLDYFRLDESHILVPITVQFENKELNFDQEGGRSVYVARMAVYGKVTSLTNRVVKEFDDDMMTSYQAELFPKGRVGLSMYQRIITLEAKMRYKLDLVVKDVKSGKVGVIQQAIIPPSYSEQKLASSSLMLSSSIRTLDSIPQEDQMFVLGDVWIRPKMDNAFPRNRPLGVYLQLYNAALDQTSYTPALKVSYKILKDGQTVKEIIDEHGESVQYFSGRRVVLIKVVDLDDLEPGDYSMQIEAQDQISNQMVTAKDQFQVVDNVQTALSQREP